MEGAPPKDFSGGVLIITQTEEQHGECVLLRLVEYGQRISAARDRQGSKVIHHADEVDKSGHYSTENHHQRCQLPVNSGEQPVKGQSEKDQNDGTGQVGQDAEPEE
jgi:hypothetical protein